MHNDPLPICERDFLNAVDLPGVAVAGVLVADVGDPHVLAFEIKLVDDFGQEAIGEKLLWPPCRLDDPTDRSVH